MQAGARVGRLRVTAERGRGLITARALVEDALRTSGADAGRGLLVVRRLSVGRAASTADRAAVAERLAALLADARARAVWAGASGAAQADAVLFRDAGEPYRLIVRSILTGEPQASAWFLRSAMPNLVNVTARQPSQLLASVLVQAATETFGATLLPELMEAMSNEAASAVLNLTTSEAGTILSMLTGGTVEILMPPAKRMDTPSMPGRQTLVRQAHPSLRRAAQNIAQRVGSSDPRARLGAALVLASTQTPPLSHTAIREVTVLLAQWDEDNLSDPPPSRAALPAADLVAAGAKSEDRAQVPDLTGRRVDTKPNETEPREIERTPSASPSAITDTSTPENAKAPADKPKPVPDPAEPTHTPTKARTAPPDQEPTVTDGPTHAQEPPASPRHPEKGEPSAWAGAFLLIRLLTRLLPDLTTSSQGRELGLGRILLTQALTHAGAPAHDPASRVLTPLADPMLPDTGALDATSVRTLWPDPPTLVIRPVRGHRNWRALTDPRGRLVFGLWHGRAPEAVRALHPGRRHRRALDQPLHRLLTTAELALRRMLRDLTGQHPNRIVGRSGWIRASRTHVDVTFDAGLVDTGVRRAGLDIDPGWCAWFGRVVTIHYDYGGHDA